MSGNGVLVCDLFEQIKEYYKKHNNINADLLANLILEMQKFEGSAKIVNEIENAFDVIENGDINVDRECIAATDEWRFNFAIKVFNKFKVQFAVEHKKITDPPVQQENLKAIEQELPQTPKSTLQQPESQSTQQAAQIIAKQYENCFK